MTQVGAGNAAAVKNEVQVRVIRTCLVFNDRAEEAVNFYVSLFKNSRVLSMVRSDGKGPIPEGRLVSATFELDGREFRAFDGGPSFSFSEGISMDVVCDTQDELDRVWERLTSEGGEEGPCGWLKDRFGVSWQIVPAALGEMMSDSKHGDPAKVMHALLKMRKLDIAALEQAYRSGS
jgi:predicted 3-demethylubiquinone-9 3-methyltransferase (glyoxalase superfamily)